MSSDDWILALHVLSGFAFVASMVLFWVLVLAVRRTDLPTTTAAMEPVAKVGNAAGMIGATGTIVFGVWLAFSVGGYDIWDGWIIAALVLWVLSGWAGSRTAAEYTRGLEKAKELLAAGETEPSAELRAINRTQRGLVMHVVTSLAVLLILVDMIWKPGA